MVKAKAFSRFVTREEVAKYFGVSRMTLYRWSKIVPLTSYPGKHIRLTEDEAATWQKKVRVEESRIFLKRIS